MSLMQRRNTPLTHVHKNTPTVSHAHSCLHLRYTTLPLETTSVHATCCAGAHILCSSRNHHFRFYNHPLTCTSVATHLTRAHTHAFPLSLSRTHFLLQSRLSLPHTFFKRTPISTVASALSLHIQSAQCAARTHTQWESATRHIVDLSADICRLKRDNNDTCLHLASLQHRCNDLDRSLSLSSLSLSLSLSLSVCLSIPLCFSLSNFLSHTQTHT